MPKVSVVLAVYNGERFLAETMESILTQTFRDFEFIIVDDGSTDGTPDILATFAQADPRIVVKRQARNTGIPASRNLGCRMATGDYIAVTDGDDISLPNRFEKQVDFLDQHPEIALIGSSIDRIDEAGTVFSHVDVPTDPGFLKWMLIFVSLFFHSSVMMRRDVAASLDFYSEQAPVALDHELLARMSLDYRLTNLPEVLLRYRVTATNITARKAHQQAQISTGVLQHLASYYLQEDVPEGAADALRAIAWHQPIADLSSVPRAASILERLYRVYTQTVELSPEEAAAVTQDTAVKFYTLARRCLKHAPLDAFGFILKGLRLYPRSVWMAAAYYRQKLMK